MKHEDQQPDLNALALKCVKAATEDDHYRFAVELDTRVPVLRRLNIGAIEPEALLEAGGWYLGTIDNLSLMVVPERDAALDVVGMVVRGDEGLPGGIGGRGLAFPLDLPISPDPILVVDGIHDLVACLGIGVAAVACPYKTLAIAYLGRLVKGRTAIVVGSSGCDERRLRNLSMLGIPISRSLKVKPAAFIGGLNTATTSERRQARDRLLASLNGDG